MPDRNGARDHLFQSLSSPIRQGGAKIGDELVAVEHSYPSLAFSFGTLAKSFAG